MEYTIYPHRLYNLDIDGVGLFKLKRVPLKCRFPYYHYGNFYSKNVWRLDYKPWHRWRVSCGEGLDYVGGFTVRQSIRNCIKVHSIQDFIKFGKANWEYVTKVARGRVEIRPQ